MDSKLAKVKIGALCHDLGKPIYWLTGESHIRCAFKLLLDGLRSEELAEAAASHHIRGINGEFKPREDIHWFICIADHIASGADRPEEVDVEGGRIKLPINTTRLLSKGKPLKQYYSKDLENFEEELRGCLSRVKYGSLAELYEKLFHLLSSLKHLKELPADTRPPRNDHSLWDHLKLTAAIATCMYLESNGEIKGYDESQYTFALVAGDARAIGRFINKSLRPRDLSARSELVKRATYAVERLVGEELGRECLLFAGGGNFLFLAPPSRLGDLTGKAKDSFERETGGELHVTVESVVCNGRDLMNFGECWRDVQAKVRRRKAIEASISAWEIDAGSEPCWVCGVRPADKIDVDIPDYMQPFDAKPRPDAVCNFCYNQRRQPYSRRVSVEEVKDGRGYIGILKMDGDGVGELFSEGLMRHYDKNPTPSRLATLSRIVDEASIKIGDYAVNLVRKFVGNIELNPVVFSGGDDLLAIIPGATGLKLAYDLASKFAEMFDGELTASAGLAFIKVKFPLYVALEAVDQLLSNAKSNGKSSVDFQVIEEVGISREDLSMDRRGYLRKMGLAHRPYKWSELDQLFELIEFVNSGVFERSQFMKLVKVLIGEGSTEAENRLKYQMGRGEVGWDIGEKLLNWIRDGIIGDAYHLLRVVG